MAALTSLQDLKFIMALGGIGAGVGLLLAGLYLTVLKPLQRRRQFQQRWQGSNKDKHARSHIFKATLDLKKGVVSTVMGKIAGWGKIDNLQNNLMQADILLSPDAFLSIMGILGCLGYLLGSMKESFYLSVGLAVFLGYTPILLPWDEKAPQGGAD